MRRALQRLTALGTIMVGVAAGGVVGSYSIARELGYPEELGQPAMRIGSIRFYYPWRVLQWSQQDSSVPPALAAKGRQWLMLGAGLGVGMAVALTLVTTRRTMPANVFGDATWATVDEVEKRGLLRGTGVFLGVLPDGRYLRHEGPEHIAVIAPTRTGKGAGIVVPTLLTYRGSVLVYDLKEENWRRTAAKRGEFSDLIYLNFNSLESSHFNPLLEIRQGIYEVRDTQNVANMVIEPDQPDIRDHWYDAANSMLVATILHVLYAGAKEEKNLAGVTAFLSRAEQRVTETLREMMTTNHLRDDEGRPYAPHPGVVAAARDVLNKSADDASGVHSTIMAKMSRYRDPLLAHNTRDSDFTIDEIVNGPRPKSLYLIIPPTDIERLRPITRLIINQICRRLTDPELTRNDSELARRHELLLLLDEFPALGHMDFFENAMAFIAGYKLRALLVCQSMNQLKKAYGERTSILDNTAVRVFFTPSTVETADYISKTLGQTTITYKTQGESGQKGSPFYSGKSESSHVSSRPLLTSREVMEFPDPEEILLVGSSRPIRAEKIRYFEDDNFMPSVKEPPPFSREHIAAKDCVWFSERFTPLESNESNPLQAPEETSDDEQLLVVTAEPELSTVLPARDLSTDDEFDDEELA